MKFPGIRVGLTRTVHHVVDERDTYGNSLPDDIEPLLSSAGLMTLAIRAAVDLIDPLLPDGFLSIGKSSSVTHEHPSVRGASLELTVTIDEFDGYHIGLRIDALDETGPVASGRHVRSIANRHWLQLRIAGRAAQTAGTSGRPTRRGSP